MAPMKNFHDTKFIPEIGGASPNVVELRLESQIFRYGSV